MKKLLKIISYIIGLQILLLIIVYISFMYLTKDMCSNYVDKIYISPNKLLKAVVFQRDCGATTGFTTQISILKLNEELANSKGNIFIISGHPNNVKPILIWKDIKPLIKQSNFYV